MTKFETLLGKAQMAEMRVLVADMSTRFAFDFMVRTGESMDPNGVRIERHRMARAWGCCRVRWIAASIEMNKNGLHSAAHEAMHKAQVCDYRASRWEGGTTWATS